MNKETQQTKGDKKMTNQAKIENIIRSQSIPLSQAGFDTVTGQLDNNEYLHPAEFREVHTNIDWLSQDGFEGN